MSGGNSGLNLKRKERKKQKISKIIKTKSLKRLIEA